MTIPDAIGEETGKQIGALRLDPARPMVICDVDEVIVHFIARLEQHLAVHECWLDRSSYALTGNIRRVADDEAIERDEFAKLLWDFFETHTENLDPIEGAVDGLNALGAQAEIVLLTNLPHRYWPARSRNLKALGLDYPVIANEGAKGPAARAILGANPHPAIFLDDGPSNLVSVIEYCPGIGAIHFIPDAGFAAVAPAVEGIALKTSAWAEVLPFATSRLKSANTRA